MGTLLLDGALILPLRAKAINEMVRRLIVLRRVGDLVSRFLRRIIDMQIRSVGIDPKQPLHQLAPVTRE
jgi:hypothetical protein